MRQATPRAQMVCWTPLWVHLGVLWGVCLCSATPVLAHHGGIGIEGDLVQWALKVDQWQDEIIDQDYRIKFLSYPRQPTIGGRTRLVFEIQSVATGRYVSGLAAQLEVRGPEGILHSVPLPETTGVTAYYETAVLLERAGEYAVTFQATDAGRALHGTFHKVVRRSSLVGDWPALVGNLTVLAAFAVTWLGLVLSIQRRFVAPSQHTPARHI